MIRYRLRRDQLERNGALLAAVYDELAAARPEGLSYTTFQLEDGVSFVALVEADRPGRFSEFASFRAYREGLDERCEEPPTVTALRAVGSYGSP